MVTIRQITNSSVEAELVGTKINNRNVNFVVFAENSLPNLQFVQQQDRIFHLEDVPQLTGQELVVIVNPFVEDPFRSSEKMSSCFKYLLKMQKLIAKLKRQNGNKSFLIVRYYGQSGGYFSSVEPSKYGVSLYSTTFSEIKGIKVKIIDFPISLHGETQSNILEQISRSEAAFEIFVVDLHGKLSRPMLSDCKLSEVVEYKMSSLKGHTFLIAGGAQGITKACLKRLFSANVGQNRFAILGRSAVDKVSEDLAVEFGAQFGSSVRYFSCNVGNESEVKAAINNVCEIFGQPSIIIHGAGELSPRMLSAVSENAFNEVKTKVFGFINLMNALPVPPKLVVAFSSVASINGAIGTGVYNYSNELLNQIIEEKKSIFPSTRFLSINWGLWAEEGAGARFDSLNKLKAIGIFAEAVKSKDYLDAFEKVFCESSLGGAVYISGDLRGLVPYEFYLPSI